MGGRAFARNRGRILHSHFPGWSVVRKSAMTPWENRPTRRVDEAFPRYVRKLYNSARRHCRRIRPVGRVLRDWGVHNRCAA